MNRYAVMNNFLLQRDSRDSDSENLLRMLQKSQSTTPKNVSKTAEMYPFIRNLCNVVFA